MTEQNPYIHERADEQRSPEELADLAGGREVSLFIVRHGQTVFNTEHRMQGWSDSPLTELGMEQIATVGRALAPVPLDLAFSSDLRRCVTTTRGILDQRTDGLEATFHEELREWNFGGHEEMLSAQVWGKLLAKHNIEVERELDAMRDLASELGWSGMFDGIANLDETGKSEFAAEIVLRADRALAHVLMALAELPGDGPVGGLVVSHGGFISTLLRQLVPTTAPDEIFPNCSVSTVTLRDGVWQLIGKGVEPQDFVYDA
ncbi:MAG TPA: histidine phosphatase family protein [Candidatus Agrococcus pullicola]|uniref:Histidine phosphatase family protein n=1 Tax=Candidatus Agrococcus pullicola TaxID=2838429 RepID=A0A9D1YXJ9_9MICO|nr:histidine phosphatase family protein [Candidatus Agrococcus pullicola]